MAPVSTFLVQSVVMEGGELFLAFHRHLQRIYPGTYAPATDDPVAPTGRAPVCGESQRGEGGGGYWLF